MLIKKPISLPYAIGLSLGCTSFLALMHYTLLRNRTSSWYHRMFSKCPSIEQQSCKKVLRKPNFIQCLQQQKSIPMERLTKERVTVVQFNILASKLATQSHFPYVQPENLNWENRRHTLMEQLSILDADIICLEELSDYWTFFKPEMEYHNYDSVYVKRPSINVSGWSGEKKHDGCGIFFKKDKFKLKECETLNYHDSHDRVALFAFLQLKDINQFILVVCTHLWWNSNKQEDQLREVEELEEELIGLSADLKDKYRDSFSQSDSKTEYQLPIIVCGDLNNSPSSRLYSHMYSKFMQGPNVEGLEVEFRSAYGHYKLDKLLNEKLHAPINENTLNKLVQESPIIGRLEPPHTTVNFRRCWTIDYIWYSTNSLVPIEVLEIPSEDELCEEDGPLHWFEQMQRRNDAIELQKKNGIPNSTQGSDHVPIMASFAFLKNDNNDTDIK